MLTLEYGINPEYVLNQIQPFEINSIMKYGYYKSKENWEQARLISYLIAQVNTKKTLKLQDIIKFQWEKENESTKITNEEINNLAKQAELMEQYFNQNNNDNTTTIDTNGEE